MREKVILDQEEISKVLSRLAHQVAEQNRSLSDIVILGIARGGIPLAERIQKLIEKFEGIRLPLGSLDVTFHRDDFDKNLATATPKANDISFSLDGKVVLLVDDVLFHGRTVRAALNAINDYGRPAVVQLLVLVDRGHRELPVRADYVGKNIPTARNEQVVVTLDPGEESVKIMKKKES